MQMRGLINDKNYAFVKLFTSTTRRKWCSVAIVLLCAFVLSPAMLAQDVSGQVASTDSTGVQPSQRGARNRTRVLAPGSNNSLTDLSNDTVHVINMDSVQQDALAAELMQQRLQAQKDSLELLEYGKERVMKINPMRALWLSALLPGLGQVYNRRYWKLPIVVGGFVGMGYAISWNNKMLKDYTKAYGDIMDSDPKTNSYMDFYPPTVSESEIDPEWLKKTLKSKKDYFRRNRDLCVIGIAGVYLICLVDAYVDASLAKFDISEDLSMKVKPALMQQYTASNKLPGVGVACAFTF